MRNIDREIWRLLWPVLLLTVAQKLGSAFEGVLVSVNSTNELAVMGVCGPYITIITTVSYGLGIAANAAMGRACSDGSWEASYRRYISVFVQLTLICGGAMSLIAAGLLYPALKGLEGMEGLGYMYMLPYLIGSLVLLLYSLLVSCTRGMGDARCGMYMTFISVSAQLVVSYICYSIFGLKGLGWGTLISRLGGCIYGAWRFRGMLLGAGGCEPLGRETLMSFIKLALPVSLSKAVDPTGNALINSLMLSVSPLMLSVKGLGGRLEPFFYLTAMAMCSVTVTMVSRERSREKQAPLWGRLCLWGVLPTVCLVIIAGLFSDSIWPLLTADAELIAAGMNCWRISLMAYPMIALEMILTSILQALGKGMPTLAATVLRIWAVQVPLTFIFTRLGNGENGAWLAYLISNGVSLALCGVWTYLQLKNKIRRTV